jgi:diguanylate cyclase (GGDEF)-like protein/PAS domain S-box-containing protein
MTDNEDGRDPIRPDTVTAPSPAIGRAELFRQMVEQANEGIWAVDADGRTIFANQRMAEMLGCGPDDLARANVLDFVHGEDHDALRDALERRQAGMSDQGERRYQRADGTVLVALVSASPLTDTSGRSIGSFALITDITARSDAQAALVERESRLFALAHYDRVTGLATRALVDETLERAGRPVAVLFADLDGFKAINDTWGHAVGDRLLAAVAGRIQGTVRASDTAGRYGGDEFVVVAPGTDGPDADALANRLLSAVARPYDIGGRTLEVGLSMGLTISASSADTGAELLDRADEALYFAKAAGGRRWMGYVTGMAPHGGPRRIH